MERPSAAPCAPAGLVTSSTSNARDVKRQRSDPHPLVRDELYREFAPLVQRLIRQYGTDAEFKQDLKGEIYCCFSRLLDEFQPDRGIPFRPYMVRQLSASVYSYARSHWRQARRERAIDLSALETGGFQLVDPSSDWDDTLVRKQRMKSLPAAIVSLPDRQRSVLVQRYYDGLSFEQIGSVLGIQPATARSLLRYALTNLRKTMGMAETGRICDEQTVASAQHDLIG